MALDLLSEQVDASRDRVGGDDAVATHHEPAQAMAHTCSAIGVSDHHAIRTTWPFSRVLEPDRTLPMPLRADVYAFVRASYLHSRFEGRNDAACGLDYSDRIVDGYMRDLETDGYAVISIHESRIGRVLWFDRALRDLAPDAPPDEVPHRAGNLTHIYGASL